MISSCNKQTKLGSYYSKCRKVILELFPANAKTVLSVGCGEGVTESELVKKGIKVYGIEINSDAANTARENGVIVMQGDASLAEVSRFSDEFDCLIFADVLEHFADPILILKRYVKYLKSNGTVIVSVPNFRHYSFLFQLFVCGNVKYSDAGILDRTHLRITTRKSVIGWFDQVNLKVKLCRYMITGRKDNLLSAASMGVFKEFLSEQVVIVGKINI